MPWVGPRFVAESDGLLVVLPAVGNVVHGVLHVLVADARAKVLVEDGGNGARVEDGEGGVKVDEASLFVRVKARHDDVWSGRLDGGVRIEGWKLVLCKQVSFS